MGHIISSKDIEIENFSLSINPDSFEPIRTDPMIEFIFKLI